MNTTECATVETYALDLGALTDQVEVRLQAARVRVVVGPKSGGNWVSRLNAKETELTRTRWHRRLVESNKIEKRQYGGQYCRGQGRVAYEQYGRPC